MTAPRTRFQRFLRAVLPTAWFEKIAAESRRWHIVCPCGFAISYWDAGGVRFNASRRKRIAGRCPDCGRTGWLRVEMR